MDRCAEANRHTARCCHLPRPTKYAIDATQADWNYRHIESGRHDADSGPEGLDFAVLRSFPFGKNQDRKSVRQEFSGVSERLPRSGLALRQRKSVEEGRRQPVVQTVGE